MRRMLLVVVLAVLCGACGGPAVDETEPSSEVEGIVVEVESTGLNEVESFVLKDGDEFYTILIDPEIEYPFPLGHLEEHRTGALPVHVELEERDGKLYARSIEDA